MVDKKDHLLEILRHSAAHLTAQALLELYPDTQLTIGPATKTGFFYDFQSATSLKESDLERISERMRYLAEQAIPFTHEQMDKKKAKELYKNNPFKLELIDNLPGETVGIARQGDFYDLCRGGHVQSTAELKHFILTGLSGSYWRADREQARLQRISGVVFPTSKELRLYLKKIQDAEQYDHRKLGKEMNLFSFHQEGAGFPFYHAKGTAIFNGLKDYMRTIWKKHNYQEIITPAMLDADLWKRSGHYDHYKNNMYFCAVEDRDYAIKPMNCPGAILTFKERPHSFRDLPLRLSEFGHVHRFELSGVLHGLFRVRAFTIDDSHTFCTPEQLESEILNSINIIDHTFKKFNFSDVSYAVSTRPEKSMGSAELWETATNALRSTLTKAGKEYRLLEGEGAFYGPKIEVTIKDSMDREWQCSTVQIDFFQPQNFDISYVASGGEKKQPVMIHQAVFGSLERFLGIIIEHLKGHMPFWLSPIQVKILPITSEHAEYAASVVKELENSGVRVELDENQEPLSAKIKSAQLERIPWMLVIGDKEVEQKTVTLRHASGKQEFGITVEDIVKRAQELNSESK